MRRFMVGLAAGALASATLAAPPKYPPSPRGDVVDHHHGIAVPDPYRWLEDLDSRETRRWIDAQNALTQPLLRQLPDRERLERRLTELWDYERFDVPIKAAGRYFFKRNDGLQNQSALYVQDSATAPRRVLVDPNVLAADGTVALTDYRPSPDGRHVAYALADAGSDWNQIRVVDSTTAKDGGDVLGRVKFSRIAWTRDSKGFFYSRYPAPPAGAVAGVFDELAGHALYYHRVGTPQAQDVLVYGDPAQPKWNVDGTVTDDGNFLLISLRAGANSANRLYYKFLGPDPKQPRLDGKVDKLIDDFDARFKPIGNEGPVLYVLTDRGAPRKSVVAIDLRSAQRKNWQTLVPEGPDVIDDAVHAGRQLVLVYMKDAASRVVRFDMAGQELGEVKLPGLGALTKLQGETQIRGWPADPELFFSYTAFNLPPTNYRCELSRGRCVAFQTPALRFDPDDYVTTRVFYKSKDGTRVPMFISHRDGLEKDGRTPTLLYGYGGFDISLTPAYSVGALAWMERGGIYAQACLRGGGEYGRSWHEAGTKERKQNVFDDFIAAAEHLVREGYTKPAHLAIEGRSNGGLLVGAVMNQRPELFAVGLPAVGVMDMLRYHKFTIGWAWVKDYGSADDPREFAALRAYSPYHNLKPGARYPAVLVTTADHDDRVVPAHSFKYAAALQAAQGGDRPTLIRIDVKAGHGAGKPTGQIIEETADRLAFALRYTRGD